MAIAKSTRRRRPSPSTKLISRLNLAIEDMRPVPSSIECAQNSTPRTLQLDEVQS